MRKKILLLCSLFILLCSFVLINRLQKSNFNVFNTVSSDEAQMLQNQLERKDELSFTALLCNDIRVPFDDASSTFYVPLNMETESWEKLEFISGQPEYQVIFGEDVTERNKQEVISKGERFEITVFDQNFWAPYYIVFTGLPIIDLATNEGFYSV